MNNYSENVQNLRRKYNLFQYQNELEQLQKTDFLTEEDKNRIPMLEKIITHKNNNLKKINTKESNNNINKMFDIIDDNIYKRPWRVLSHYHKQIKLKEYIKTLTVVKKEQDTILELLLNSIESKIIKIKDIKYKPLEQKIDSIPKLVKNDNKWVI